MRLRFATLPLLPTLLAVALFVPGASATEPMDWHIWRQIPVQNGGRQKPLDTLAWETLRLVANRGVVVDPVSQQKLGPLEFYLTALFDWQGWEHDQKEKLRLATDWRPMYFHVHQADKWDRLPLLRVDYLALRAKLGLKPEEKNISPADLAAIQVEDRPGQKPIPFSTWADQLVLVQQGGKELDDVETKALELADRLWAYQNHRMGKGMELVPMRGDKEPSWATLAQLMLAELDEETDPGGNLRHAQRLLLASRTAYQEQNTPAFNAAARELVGVLRTLGREAADYPTERAIGLEVAYNQWVPFRIAWVLMLVAAVGMLLHLGTAWNGLARGAMAAYLASLVAVAAGFGLRMAIAGRPPVTNMYESVIYVGAGVALFGLVFELIYRQKYLLTAAASVSTVILVLADNCPVILDPSVRPLEPVLRSNFWLITHVMTITLSYAAFALALGIGNITLTYLAAGWDQAATIRALSHFTYRALQVGVLLLAAGVILGGVWADYSWGRFWGWDPKEVWALVALLGYLAVLHAAYAGWVGHQGLAALSVACFSLVVMAWYGVNFVLGAGLHSYGFGGGGKVYVFFAVSVQLIFMGGAVLRARLRNGGLLPAPTRAPVATPPLTEPNLSAS